MVKPLVGQTGQSDNAFLDLYVGNLVIERCGHVLANDGAGACCHNIGDETVGIHCNPLEGNEHHTLAGLTRIVDQVSNVNIGIPNHLQRLDGR